MADPSLSPVSSVDISPDGRLVVAASADSLAVITVPEVPFNDDHLGFLKLSADGCRKVATPAISSLCFPGQSTVYAASSSGHFSRYRVELDEDPICEYTVSDPHGCAGEVTGIASVGASSIVATSGKDGVIRCWDPETRQSIARLSGHKYEVRAVAVAESAADGETVNIIASAGRDKTVRLWDVRASESNPIHVFSGHSGWVHDVAISGGPGARADPIVLSCAGDKTVRVWNLTMMKEEMVLTGHEYRVWSVSVASDGSYALSGSTDATVRAWNVLPDVPPEKRGLILRGHHDSVLSVSVSRNCAMSVSGCEDGSVHLWNTSTLFGRKAEERSSAALVATADPSRTSISNCSRAKDTADHPFETDSASKESTTANFDEWMAPDSHLVVAELKIVSAGDESVAGTSQNDAVTGGQEHDVAPVFEQNEQSAENLAPLIDLSDSRDATVTTEVAEVVNSILELATTEIHVTGRPLPNNDAAVWGIIEQKDAHIETLTRQLRAAENLAKSANVQALRSTLDFSRQTSEPAKAPRGLLGESATTLGDVNDRIRKISSRIDVMINWNSLAVSDC